VLRAFVNAFKIPDLRKKILFTLFIIAVYRFGSHVPVPVVDVSALERDVAGAAATNQGFLSFINLFSGGALTRMAVFALGIMPYITSSIIMQLLIVVIPKLEQWQKQGEVGIKKITQWTRYMTVTLAILQSTGLVPVPQHVLGGQRVAVRHHPAGQVRRGAHLADRAHPDRWNGVHHVDGRAHHAAGHRQRDVDPHLHERDLAPAPGGHGHLPAGRPAEVLHHPGARAVDHPGGGVHRTGPAADSCPICETGRRTKNDGWAVHLHPAEGEPGGRHPDHLRVVRAVLPDPLASVYHAGWFKNFVDNHLNSQSSPVYLLLYGLLVVFFAYFYTAIQFNPVDTADNIRKYGGFIPGIRPGKPTADYLNNILVRITLPGSLFLASIALLPSIFLAVYSIPQFPFGGTAILITVGVALETMKQLESQLLMRHYEGFLR